jgi:TetR/AcrR family transcriptional repressor of nem operon
MARPRSYDPQLVVAAAKQVFWDQGYEGTAISDLESATGLSRSSLYLAFETKQGLFHAALTEYELSFVDTMLGPVEGPGAGLPEAAGFFVALATLFGDAEWKRGCLLINSITELAARDATVARRGAQFADRYRAAFSNALRACVSQGSMTEHEAVRRSELLTGAAMGAWVAVRADHVAAAATCQAIASEIGAWGSSPPDPSR